jgi:hypothetical protein
MIDAAKVRIVLSNNRFCIALNGCMEPSRYLHGAAISATEANKLIREDGHN